MLIVTPNGRQVLIDGGPEVEIAARALAGPLSLWDRGSGPGGPHPPGR
jgi:hypothetical protein